MYGPFWISTTLIIIIVASSSLITLFNDQKATYNFDKISVAAGLVSFCLLSQGLRHIFWMPVYNNFCDENHGQWLVCSWCKTFSIQLICIYGYSLISFLPITLLCFLDSEIVQMILLAIGYVVSVVFLIRGILRYC